MTTDDVNNTQGASSLQGVDMPRELVPRVNEASDAAGGGGVGGVLCVDINYPRNPDAEYRAVQIGLMDVRAADDIRVSYDFGRDGWKIEQEEIVTDHGHYQGTGQWTEVAFVDAWGNEHQVVEEAVGERVKALEQGGAQGHAKRLASADENL